MVKNKNVKHPLTYRIGNSSLKFKNIKFYITSARSIDLDNLMPESRDTNLRPDKNTQLQLHAHFLHDIETKSVSSATRNPTVI